MAPEVRRLRRTLIAARRLIAGEYESWLGSACLLDKKLQPIRDTAGEMEEPTLREYEAILARIDAALEGTR